MESNPKRDSTSRLGLNVPAPSPPLIGIDGRPVANLQSKRQSNLKIQDLSTDNQRWN